MINITTPQELTRIYLVTNCYGDPNKVYIGQTRNNRFWKHKQTFGSDINYDYIDEINSLNSKYWKPLECFWIEYFRFLGFDIQNKNNGGNGPSLYSEEARLKISNSNKGKKRSEESKQNMRKPKSESHRLNMCRPKPGNRKKKPNGFNIGRIQTKETKEKISLKLKGRNIPQEWINKSSKKKKKPILQYDLEGNFIKEWDSALDVFNELKISRTTISNPASKVENNIKFFGLDFIENGIAQKATYNNIKEFQLTYPEFRFVKEVFNKEFNSRQEIEYECNNYFKNNLTEGIVIRTEDSKFSGKFMNLEYDSRK